MDYEKILKEIRDGLVSGVACLVLMFLTDDRGVIAIFLGPPLAISLSINWYIYLLWKQGKYAGTYVKISSLAATLVITASGILHAFKINIYILIVIYVLLMIYQLKSIKRIINRT